MASLIYPASYKRPLNHFRDEYLVNPQGRFKEACGVVDITTTPANVWPVKFRSGQPPTVADAVGLVVPAGSVLMSLGFRLLSPSENSEYNGQSFTGVANQKLKLATAAVATGTQAFNASGSTAYVDSPSFGGAGNTLASGQHVFAVPPNGSSDPLAADTTFRLFTATAADAAGGNASVNKGSLPILIYASWWEPPILPNIGEINGRLVPALI